MLLSAHIIPLFFVVFNMSIEKENWSSKGKIIFCPNCKAKIMPKDDMVGKLVIKCPNCKEPFEWFIKVYAWDKKFQGFKSSVDKAILEIDKRDDISKDEKVSRIIKIISTTCAALATQPLPGMDIFYLTPIQGYMGIKISKARGLNFSESDIKTMIKELLAIVGLGMAGQNFVLTAYKIGVPFLGGFMTIPLVYGATYGIGKIMDFYFIKKSKKEKIDPKELKRMWEDVLEKKKAEGEKIKKDISNLETEL